MHDWQQARVAAVLEWLEELILLTWPVNHPAQGQCITLKRTEKGKGKERRDTKCAMHLHSARALQPAQLVSYTVHGWWTTSHMAGESLCVWVASERQQAAPWYLYSCLH